MRKFLSVGIVVAALVTRDLLLNKPVRIETDVNETDNFGRILGYVYLADGTFANERLLELGAGEFFYSRPA